MAVSAAVFSILKSLWLFLSITSVASNQSTTNGAFNTTEPNFSHTVTDNYTEFESTPSPGGTENSPVAAEPLPVSGHLLSAKTSADSLCPCDEVLGVCDTNCCCDPECGGEVVLFTSCSLGSVRSGSQQLCNQEAAYYTLRTNVNGYSELQSAVQKEDNANIFCIRSQNRIDGLSHPSPALPTDTNFDLLFKLFAPFLWRMENSDQAAPAGVQDSRGYQYGDLLLTTDSSGQRGTFHLPGPGVTPDCVNSPTAFLKNQSSRCSRRVVLKQDCSSLSALSLDTYTNIQLLAVSRSGSEVVPVKLASVILESTEGTWSELTDGGGENLTPVLLNSSCFNVVVQVVYVLKYNPAGAVVNASVSLVLGPVPEAAQLLDQLFQIQFIQEAGGEVAVHHSGNPGYVVGLPLVAGKRTTDGITRSINPRETLSLLTSAENQDCLLGPHQRSPVLFGLESTSGCTLRLDDIANCSLVSQLLLDVLRGPNYPQDVASFGNCSLDRSLDWVQIETDTSSTEAQGCSIPLSLHLDIEWTKYGTLGNPQAKIVSIKEVIQINTSSLDVLSGGSAVYPIRSSVSFIPVSAPAVPGLRATPTFNAKLPFDFFYPFV
ncbi:tectonic family member 1 [Nothobranchius furzeri]|uniref:Tectonic family member 1 n=1 Tax=Nothobranchius furzeri TaxID=105023 RepID=A0A9D3C2N1_NOTFU|nr:tectonic family member 1 [Nothobranchius furzeri]